MSDMIAKMKVSSVIRHEGQDTLEMRAICKADGYGEDGSDENNTFANFTPTADTTMNVANPALVGKFNPGDTFIVTYTKVEK